MEVDQSDIKISHRFLDEAGDTTFYGKGKILTVGNEGVSISFILGMVKFKEELEPLRERIIELQKQVCNDSYFKDIPSILKKAQRDGFYFHATDDIPEVRKLFYDFINTINCSFECVVGRKIPGIYESKHHGKEEEFYADMLSHLLKNKLKTSGKLVLNIAQRGKSTRNSHLRLALMKAIGRFNEKNKEGRLIEKKVVFNVQNHYTEPLLNVSDYFCWAVQRVFERGETRYYNFLKQKISIIHDLYDHANYDGNRNIYKPSNPLTAQNKISPPMH